ncbi:MAG: hypothetical protein Q7R70_05740 [Candidatus Diapherotrites archaeon]|nr:hypothetical protein [Candidatus Diapherotrites archaeon]
MVDFAQTLVEFFVLLINLLLLAIPLAAIVFAFGRLEGRLEKKFKLSWIKASALSAFAAVFLAILIVYLLPFSGAMQFSSNDNLPTGITTQVVEDASGQLVEQQIPGSSLLDSLGVMLVTFLRLVFISAVLTVLLLPLILLASGVFSKFAKKKSANIPAFYLSSFAGLFMIAVIILALPWIPAGIAYFIFFS